MTHALDTPLTLLGGLSPNQFMSEYWQKRPLLIRQAIPSFQSPITEKDLRLLCTFEECESRLVSHDPTQTSSWSVQHGPFRPKQLPKGDQSYWTILVQGVEAHSEELYEFLKLFRFIPDARLDDIMVSIAGKGGGVGPHIDSYDVFLFQAAGERLWEISNQQDTSFVPDMPLKILQHFEPQQSWVLQPGDMLYLPPQYAHNGIALNAGCMTYSVGFRSPTASDCIDSLYHNIVDCQFSRLSQIFYQDPDQASVSDPAIIPDSMIQFAEYCWDLIRPNKTDFIISVGQMLTDTKYHVFFESPEKHLSPREFLAVVQQKGCRLDPQTRLLIYSQWVFCNGRVFDLLTPVATSPNTPIHHLANCKRLVAGSWFDNVSPRDDSFSNPSFKCLLEFYSNGWLLLEG